MSRHVKHLIPLILLIGIICIVYYTNAHQIFTIEWLQSKEQALKSYYNHYPITVQAIYVLIYVGSVILVIPDSTILTLLGGLLFPFWGALVLAALSETLGTLIFYAILHFAFVDLLKKEYPVLKKLHQKFARHPPSYLLFLRLSHVIPFWLTNILAAYFNVRYFTMFWTTFIGVLPLTYVVARAGQSLQTAFAQHTVISLSDIFTFQVKIALLLIGLLALCPIFFQWIWHKLRKK